MQPDHAILLKNIDDSINNSFRKKTDNDLSNENSLDFENNN